MLLARLLSNIWNFLLGKCGQRTIEKERLREFSDRPRGDNALHFVLQLAIHMEKGVSKHLKPISLE
jgi:hypothetical protein